MISQADYIKNAIIETIKETTDEGVLNYIYTLLMNALVVESESQQEAS
jgi:hypothetical protein